MLVNADGFWDPLLALFARMSESGLLAPEHAAVPSMVADVAGALAAIDAHRALPNVGPPVEKW